MRDAAKGQGCPPRAVVRARNALAPFGGDEITEALILLDRWLARQDEATKKRLAAYFGAADLPVSARPKEAEANASA